jgi:hypothetical protein
VFAVLIYRPSASGSAALSSALAEDLRRIEAHRGPGLAVVFPRSSVREAGRAADWRLSGYRYAAGAAVGAAACIDFKSMLYALLAAVIIDHVMRRATSAKSGSAVDPVQPTVEVEEVSAGPVEITEVGEIAVPVQSAGSTEPAGRPAETGTAVESVPKEAVQVGSAVPAESAEAVVPPVSGGPAAPVQSAGSTGPTGQSAA